MTSLVGKVFILDDGESYRTGTIAAEIRDGAYLLVAFDDMSGRNKIKMPMEVASFDDLLRHLPDGRAAWVLFETRDDLTHWFEWLNAPDARPKIVSISREPK